MPIERTNSGQFKKGFKHSKEWKKNNSLRMKGRVVSSETREKIRKHHSLFPSKSMLGRKHSLKTRLKMSLACKKELRWNWKGGVTAVRRQIYHSFEYKIWRNSIFKRDKFMCVLCKSDSSEKKLNVDHIYPFSLICDKYNIQTLEQGLECSELWNLNNGRTLCIECHKKTDTYGIKLVRSQLKNKLI